MTIEQKMKAHWPRAGSVVDRGGRPCLSATADSYPLFAECECGSDPRYLICADGTADWTHDRRVLP